VRAAAKAQGRYKQAVEELEQARAALSDEVGLAEWCASGGDRFGEAANDVLGGRDTTSPGGPPPLNFSRVIAALHEDIEHLSEWSRFDRLIDTPKFDWARIRRAEQ
jgi:hypothetical protein